MKNHIATRRCKVKRFATREPEGWAEPILPRHFQKKPMRTRRCEVKRFATREPKGWAEPIPPRHFQKETHGAPGDVARSKDLPGERGMGGANPAEAFSKENPWQGDVEVKRFATREPEGWAEPIPPRHFQKKPMAHQAM